MNSDQPSSDLSSSVAPMDVSESVDLAQKAHAGDRSSLDKLLRRYQERLRRIVRIRLGARMRANLESMDIVQEAMIVASRKIETADLRSSGAILNWLARIAERKIHDAHDYQTAQRRDRRRETPLQVVISGESVGWEPPDEASSPSTRAEREEVSDIVDETLIELSDDHREVIVLRHYCGVEWDEAAKMLGRSVPAAQELHRRAWDRLRELVRPKLQGWNE